MNPGNVFGQYNLCNRYNGYADFQNFVQNQAPVFYNHFRPPPNPHGDASGNTFPNKRSGLPGYYHQHANSQPNSGQQFIADYYANCRNECWYNGAIVQQPYDNHKNNAAVFRPNPVAVGPVRPSVPRVSYNQAVQNVDKGYAFYQKSDSESATHVAEGFHKIEAIQHSGRYQHSPSDTKPEWLKRRDSCVFCRIYDEKEPNEILFRDGNFVVFADHRPVAPNHLLVVTKMHVPNILKLKPQQWTLVADMVKVGKELLLSRGANVEDSRIGFHKPPRNSVDHLHLHVISPASTLSFGEKKRFGLDTWFFVPAEELIEELAAQA